jgi:hypothetical protein
MPLSLQLLSYREFVSLAKARAFVDDQAYFALINASG